MDIQEILAQLERGEGRFPTAAVQEAMARREEIIPPLLEVLENVAQDPQPFASDGERMIHIYAMYLLAQFREPRAYPLLVRIVSAPGEVAFDLFEDSVTNDLGRILASVSNGDIRGMTSLIENPQANEYVRAAAMDGLLALVACGERSREEVMGYFKRLLQELDRTPGMVWDGLADSCADLYPAEAVAELRRAYEDDLVDPDFISWRDIERALERGQEAAMDELKQRRSLITDVVQEMSWWACFHPDEGRYRPSTPPVTVKPVRETPKVGRNDPCPCGSGKKFKKCCGS
jgi:uncharacterized protein DUF1186/SEC-C motif-containing protein